MSKLFVGEWRSDEGFNSGNWGGRGGGLRR